MDLLSPEPLSQSVRLHPHPRFRCGKSGVRARAKKREILKPVHRVSTANEMRKKNKNLLANSENVGYELLLLPLLVVHSINKSWQEPIDLKPEHNV